MPLLFLPFWLWVYVAASAPELRQTTELVEDDPAARWRRWTEPAMN